MRPALSVAVLILCCLPALGQIVDATRMGEPVDLAGNWLYHSGDDPSWREPNLPDSGWRTVSTNVDWYAHGSLWTGTYWYRLHVRLPKDHPPLELLFDYMGNPYQAYVNGTLVGSFGRFPPDPQVMRPLIRTFPVPADTGDSMVIAIRFWTPPWVGGHWGGLRGDRPVVLGPADAIDNEYVNDRSQIFYPWLPDICIGFVAVVLALGLSILFLWQRQATEYIWIAGYLFVITGWNIFNSLQTALPINIRTDNLLTVGLLSVGQVLLLQFVFAFLRLRMPLWLKVYQLSLPFQILLTTIGFALKNARADEVIDLINLLWTAPYAFLLPGVVLYRYLRGLREAGLLVIPILLITVNDMLSSLGALLFEMHIRHNTEDIIPPFNVGDIPISSGQIAGLLFVLSIGALLVYRFQTTAQQRARAQSELEAARSMQDVMVPKLHHVPGFSIESAYFPAQEVGGDFFQLFPSEDKSLLVVIGDVSGKGIKAAMLVSMILGVLQRSVEATRSPAQILRDLNRCILGQTDGKFATCCCVLICPDGQSLAANAGHLSPYCDGEEITFPGGFPLGVSSEAEYDEIELNLPPGKRWLFLSDGVVEARDKTGQLYGFDRTRSLSLLSVEQIAETARLFGQEDDITVLGVQRQTVYA